MTLQNEKTASAENIIIRKDVQKLVRMLSHQRPSGSSHKDAYLSFLKEYIEPVFGRSDLNGNYVKVINDADGNHPRIAYMAHHDTVHKNNIYNSGNVKYYLDKQGDTILCVGNDKVPMVEWKGKVWDKETKSMVDTVSTRPDTNDDLYANCLGADCTAGVWLILEMIETGCPGVYVIHADEEIGCSGSSQLVYSYNAMSKEEKADHWISKVDIAMSFDRYGTGSIITYQSGTRTSSEDFAEHLGKLLESEFKAKGYGKLTADDGGFYTDSNEYKDIISECTNISVGYYDQHSARETQNVSYLLMLRDALVEKAVDLNNKELLPATRDPNDYDSLWGGYGYRSNYGTNYRGYNTGHSNYYDDDYYYGGTTTMGGRKSYYMPLYSSEHKSASILSNDMIPIEDKLDKKHKEFFEYDGEMEMTHSEEEADTIAEWVQLFPMLTAYLIQNMGISPSDFIVNMKREALRQRRFQRFEVLFSKDKNDNTEVQDDEIPFDLLEVLGVVDTSKLLTDQSVEKVSVDVDGEKWTVTYPKGKQNVQVETEVR